MRYYIKCKLNLTEKQKLQDSIKNGELGCGNIFYEGMQTALREGTIDDDNIVHFIEVCYCLEGGLYPMAMEIPELNKYFENIEIKDARLRNQCTMECEFCDCTRNVKLPGKSLLVEELRIDKEIEYEKNIFIDIGRIKLNRKKQDIGIQGLRTVIETYKNDNQIKSIFSAASTLGLFAIFYDYKDNDYFRIKNIPDTMESRRMLKLIGLDNIYQNVKTMQATARASLAKTDKRSNVV